MLFRFLITGFFFLILLPVFGQEEERTIEELLLEQLGEELGDQVDVSEIMEKLLYYKRHPIDLNKTNERELSNLIFLSTQQIENILYHRSFTGDFINILELQGIKGLSLSTIQFLQYFVKVGDFSPLKDVKFSYVVSESDQTLILRYSRNLDKSIGYKIEDESKSHYLGDENRYALRYRLNYDNRIKIAFNAEKDAGEPFFKGEQRYGFDFYGGHLEINSGYSKLKKIVIGDYGLQFGQGLVLWNGLSFGKGAWIGAVARQGMGLQAYSSLNENNFQRGVAATLVFSNWEWTPFLAYNSLSGNREEVDGSTLISTINYSGLHRTPTELSYRDEVKQMLYGSNVTYRSGRFKAGFTMVGQHFNGKIIQGEELRNQFDFEGKTLYQAGLHYQYNFKNYFLFGETAYSLGGGLATNNGIIASLHPKISVFGNYRNYQRNYHNFYGQSLSEGSSISKEKGIYAGLVYQLTRKIEWSNYLDVFQFPWMRYRVDGPSSGTDFLSQFTYSWYKKGHIQFRYRQRLREENLSLDDRFTNLLASVRRSQIRLDFQYKLNKDWDIRTRVERSIYAKEQNATSSGMLLYQDVFWKSKTNKISVSGRIAYFDTDGYNARLYAYESDVLYASSFPMYYDKGIRSYLNIRLRVSKSLEFWTRYAMTVYANRESVGSGLEEVEGNKKTDIKFQLRWQL